MKKIVSLNICFILLTINAFSQKVFKELPAFPFVNYQANKIVFPSDNNEFGVFYDKLDNLLLNGKGNINIVHIGGSHIQADIYSNQFRKNLLAFHPGVIGGRGLIFPYKVASTNNPLNYKTVYSGHWTSLRNVARSIDKPLGLSGITVSTTDSTAFIYINVRNDETGPLYEFNRIKVLCNVDSTSFEPIVQIDSAEIIHGIYNPGSLSYSFELPVYTNQFILKFLKTKPYQDNFSLRGFLVENDFPGISYHSVGVNGASVPSYLACELFENDLAQIKPDMVILSIGINDANTGNFDKAQFIKNYEALIKKIKTVSPDCVILFTTNNDSYRRIKRRYYVNRNGLEVQKAFYELAAKYHGGVWDMFAIMGGLESMELWEDAGLAKRDKVHFLGNGYRFLGDMFYNAFVDSYLNHLSNKN